MEQQRSADVESVRPQTGTQTETHGHTREEYLDYAQAAGKVFNEEMKDEAEAFLGTQQYQTFQEVMKEAAAQMPPEVILPFKTMLLEKVVRGGVAPQIDSLLRLKAVFREGIRDAVSERNSPVAPNEQQKRLEQMSNIEQEFWLAGRSASASL